MSQQHVGASSTAATSLQRKDHSDPDHRSGLKARSGSTSTSSSPADASDKRPHVTFTSVDEFKHESTIDPPENYLAGFPMRPRSLSHHLSAEKVPSRHWLRVRARWWRSLQKIGIAFHALARPPAPKPAYKRSFTTDGSPIELFFYLPPHYYETLRRDPNHRFPVVVNFHGGGFTLGDARDDRYWARVVLKETGAVFVSVNYRRAPEHPFPIPVDDSADALLYLSEHAADLHIDPKNMGLTGFSAGANLVFAVPLRLAYHRKIRATVSRKSHHVPFAPQSDDTYLRVEPANGPHPPFESPFDTPSPTASRVSTRHDSPEHDSPSSPDHDYDSDDAHQPETPLNPPTQTRDFARPQPGRSTTSLMLMHTNNGAPLRITCIIAWYPLLDWTQSRSSKKRNSLNPPKVMPKVFTDLFDHSYLPPPDPAGHHASPYASPGLAPGHMLSEALPTDIQLWLCEWDMLLREGQMFVKRLEQLGKNVTSKLIPRVPHGWNLSPNPWRDQAAIDQLYVKAARGLDAAFKQEHDGLMSSASSIQESIVDRQPRRSIVLPM
jgi:putative ergosteryl-3beta-O-L-aspartate hydrolase